jgi:hypothetical protein
VGSSPGFVAAGGSMKTRKPSRKEKSAFAKFEQMTNVIQLENLLNYQLLYQVEIASKYAQLADIKIPSVDKVRSRIDNVYKHCRKLNALIGGVRNGDLALKFGAGKNGDFGIVGPASMNDDERMQYEMGAIISVVVGVIGVFTLVSSVIWTVDNLRIENREIRERLEATRSVANDKFCENPNSDVCKRWIDFRNNQGYQKHETAITKLGASISSSLQKAKDVVFSGVSWAVPIAIIAGVAIFAMRKK